MRLGITMCSAALLAVATLVLASCGTPAPSGQATPVPSSPDTPAFTGQSPDTDFAAQLAGRDFESTSVEGYQLADGSTLTISFFDDGDGAGITTSAGCNTMGEDEPAWHGDELTVPGGEVTAMGCEQPLMTQDQWWFALLAGGVHVALDGDELTLSAPDVADPVKVHFIDSQVTHPDQSLQQTTWRLDGIISGTGGSASVSSVPNTLTASMTISSRRTGVLTIDVFNGLTWFASPGGQPGEPVSVDGDIVRVPEMLTGDAIGCPGGGSDCFVDMSMLGHDFRYEISADRLTATGIGPTEGQGLMFVADDSLRGWAEG